MSLAALTLLVYAGVLGNDFVNFDDAKFVVGNQQVRQGLSWEGLKWALTDMAADYWHPVLWLSHMLDVTLFGMKAGGHHLTSLLIHTLNALLLFGFLRYATGRLWASAFVAALFALHPLHVESVAWISERKDVLSTFFWFAVIWMYAYYARNGGWIRYAGVMVLFALGLMTKPMLVTVPLVLLLLDYWPLERLSIRGWRLTSPTTRPWMLVVEKLPLMAMAAGVAVTTIVAQVRVSTMAPLEEIGLGDRIWNASVSYWRYISMMFWPKGLAVLYPYRDLPNWWQGMIAIVFLVAASFIIYRARSRKYLVMGWLWYLIVLIPVIGLIQVGPQLYADRYTYISLTGLFIIVAWMAADFLKRKPALRIWAVMAAAVALTAASVVTMRMVGYWRNTESLAKRAVSVTEGNYMMLTLLAQSQIERGEYDSAYANLRQSLKVGPESSAPHAWILLSRVLYERGQFAEAVDYGRAAIEEQPDARRAWLVVGMALSNLGQYEEAERCLNKVIELDPGIARAYAAIGKIRGETGRVDEGIALYRKALELEPKLDDVQFNLAVLYKLKDEFRLAAESYSNSIMLKPSYEAWNGLGDCLVAIGKLGDAEQAYRASIRMKPDEPVTHYNLSLILASTGRVAEAIEEAKKTLAFAPDNGDARELYRKLTEERAE